MSGLTWQQLQLAQLDVEDELQPREQLLPQLQEEERWREAVWQQNKKAWQEMHEFLRGEGCGQREDGPRRHTPLVAECKQGGCNKRID